ncbi:MAG TPA: GAF domain-containing protein [Rhizobiaceae bacterium]|nr:GAF domain-containing protein [Rhizobiaceae bacterium]
MQDKDVAKALETFDTQLGLAKTADAVWNALHVLTDAVVGTKLFSVMMIDWPNERSGRVYTSHPAEYPVSGTKPINRTHWFDTIHAERKPFVANTIKDIAEVFPDHELIWSLGLGSVINLPIVLGDELAGTLNLLHEEHFYTPERVNAASRLSLAGKAAFLAAMHFDRGEG